MLMFVLTMAIAFLGYVLPWGQMSYWGATVITNFFTVIPLWGFIIVEWLWGGFGVGQATLGRFFALHFLLPLVLLGLVGLHIFLLHIEGSISPLGIETIIGRIPFYIYYIIKDLVGVMWFFLAFAWIVFYEPLMFAESENFIRANPMVTPAHIVPEWYFLYAYAILRCIPKKGLGVIALVLSIVILAIMPLNHTSVIISKCWLPLSKLIFWLFISNFILNTLLGGAPVAYIYTIVAQTIGLSYFLFFISFFPTSGAAENKIIFT
jgi:quinol-cytochrome oxidoreductase complex cytochrome b subunit